ncbi:MAG: hypothetical protein ACJAZ1_003560 [Yoonia sp.]|jgi:hypothetical protein
MAATKIATCCYCGTKAALVLRGIDKHELACSNCGAPLRSLKILPVSPDRPRDPVARFADHRSKPVEKCWGYVVSRPKKRRKTKRFGRRVFSQLWDVIEDVVDDVFD